MFYGDRRFEKPVLHSLLKFFVKQKLYLASPQFIDNNLYHWIEWKTKLNEPLTECPSHGLLIELADMRQRIYENDKAEFDKLLNENNNKNWLYFEDETFMCRPLLTCAQFHDEATQQNNCVERMYLKNCAHGETHIVSVRRKSSPDTSCITCEINNDYEIVQYLHANNSQELKKDEEVFYKKLKAHLQEVKV